jgi:hypothetical protein
MDHLGRELIEAYRQVGDTDIFCPTRNLDGPDEIVAMHHKMAASPIVFLVPAIGRRVSAQSQ